MEQITLGERLANLRKEHGYTQQQLAQILSYSDKVISKWETNASIPDINVLSSLAKLYNMSLDEIVLDATPIKNTESKFKLNSNYQYIVTTVVGLFLLIMHFFPYIGFDIENLNGFDIGNLIGMDMVNLTVIIGGFKALTLSPNGFTGLFLVAMIWVTFLTVLALLAIGIIGIVNDKLIEEKNKYPKLWFMIPLVLVVWQIIMQFIFIGSMKIGSIMIMIIFIFYTIYEYRTYKKNKINNNILK